MKKENIVRRYYPVFESLILFILDYGKWWKAFRLYINDELEYRTGLALQTLIYFIFGSTFLGFSLIWILIGFYFLLNSLLGSDYLAAFIVGGVFLVISLILLQLMLKFGRKIFDANKEDILRKDFEESLD